MPMLPVPAFVALILAYLALRAALSGGRVLLVVLLVLAAWQSLAVALVGGYGVDALRAALPVTATAIPALAWVTFRTGLYDRTEPLALHGAAPVLTLACVAMAPALLDVVVSGVFLGYGVAILVALRGSGDLPRAQLGAGALPAWVWRALGCALILSAVTDALIALAYQTGRGGWAGWIVTMFSSTALLALGLLSASPYAQGAGDDGARQEAPMPASPPAPDPGDLAEDAAILARLDALLARDAPHLDPNLTLARLARRLHVAEKRLSAAVNRATGGNVSRHINAWRIRHACGLLDTGASVTAAMLESGFNTKSNFNREFLRVTGMSPSAYARVRRHLT